MLTTIDQDEPLLAASGFFDQSILVLTFDWDQN
jgi:hypothetical protein